MRIAYVAYLTARTGEGVRAKIAAQLRSWSALGHQAELLCLTPDATVPDYEDVRVFPSAGKLGRLQETRRIAAALAASEHDVAYIRYDLFVPPLRPTRRWPPVIVEVNTDDATEFRLRGRRVAAYNIVNRQLLFRGAAGAVFVSRALATSPSFAVAPTRRLVLGNGVDLDNITEAPAPANERLRFAFVGYPSPWQAVDKVVRLARALPDARFEIVGFTRDMLGDPPQNVIAHGPLPRHRVSEVMACCDVAIGTLGLHRKGMDETSPLKVREYLAYGLPTVIGNRDTDFSGPLPWFLLELPNIEDNVERSIDRISAFAAAVRGRRVAHSEIAALDLKLKEKERLAFLAETAGPLKLS